MHTVCVVIYWEFNRTDLRMGRYRLGYPHDVEDRSLIDSSKFIFAEQVYLYKYGLIIIIIIRALNT